MTLHQNPVVSEQAGPALLARPASAKPVPAQTRENARVSAAGDAEERRPWGHPSGTRSGGRQRGQSPWPASRRLDLFSSSDDGRESRRRSAAAVGRAAFEAAAVQVGDQVRHRDVEEVAGGEAQDVGQRVRDRLRREQHRDRAEDAAEAGQQVEREARGCASSRRAAGSRRRRLPAGSRARRRRARW